MEKTAIDLTTLEPITDVLRAIAHPIRLSIIEILKEGERNVSEIHEELHIEQAVASHHLRIMRDRKVVFARRDGKKTYYSLANPLFYAVLELMMAWSNE